MFSEHLFVLQMPIVGPRFPPPPTRVPFKAGQEQGPYLGVYHPLSGSQEDTLPEVQVPSQQTTSHETPSWVPQEITDSTTQFGSVQHSSGQDLISPPPIRGWLENNP